MNHLPPFKLYMTLNILTNIDVEVIFNDAAQRGTVTSDNK